MKNADMPAMPQNFTQDPRGRVAASMAHEGCGGLTKREYFAGLAMQGMVRRDSEPHPGALAYDAVVVADALLAELERNQ